MSEAREPRFVVGLACAYVGALVGFFSGTLIGWVVASSLFGGGSFGRPGQIGALAGFVLGPVLGGVIGFAIGWLATLLRRPAAPSIDGTSGPGHSHTPG